MTIGWHFDNTYLKLSKTFREEIKPTPVHDPNLVILNEALAKDLNLDFSKIDNTELSKLFCDNINYFEEYKIIDPLNIFIEHIIKCVY